MPVVFRLTKILRAEQFLGADNLRALFGGPIGCGKRFFQISRRIGRATGLDQTDTDGFGF